MKNSTAHKARCKLFPDETIPGIGVLPTEKSCWATGDCVVLDIIARRVLCQAAAMTSVTGALTGAFKRKCVGTTDDGRASMPKTFHPRTAGGEEH